LIAFANKSVVMCIWILQLWWLLRPYKAESLCDSTW
jgi:hypothetical protein